MRQAAFLARLCMCVCGTALASNLLSAATMSFATLNALKAEVAVMRAFKKNKNVKSHKVVSPALADN